MPAWVMHLKLAKKVNETLNLDEAKFLVGNVMVDAQGYIIDNLSVLLDYDTTHFATYNHIKNMNIKLPNYEKFIIEYKEYLNNPVVLGYYTHLLADYFWNNLTFSKYFITNTLGDVIGIRLNNGKEEITDKESIRIIKQQDFEMYSRKIATGLDINIDLSLVNEIFKDASILKTIPYTKEDIEKIVKYLNNIENMYEKKDKNEFTYKVFTKEKFDKYFDMSEKFVLENIKKLNIKNN